MFKQPALLSQLLAIGFCGSLCSPVAICQEQDLVRLQLHVAEQATGRPIAARVYLQNVESKRYYYVSCEPEEGTAFRYQKQNWLNADSVEYHTTVSAGSCFAEVPPGDYLLRVERGKTYVPVEKRLTLVRTRQTADAKNTTEYIELKRWDAPEIQGWYCGDTHLHRNVTELRNVIMAENLNVAMPLTHWVTTSGTPPKSGNKNQADIPKELVAVDATHVIWPRNTEYEIFHIGEKRHTLGALFVLGQDQELTFGVPPWKPAVEAGRVAGRNVLFDMDKLDWPFAMLLPTLAPNALYELSNNHVWQTEFAFEQWNSRAPAYMQPPYGAQRGVHRAWLDYTHGMYYSLLNCGLRLPPSAGTANGVHPVPAGFSRVYVHVPEDFSYAKWMEGLARGQSFVTTGPMLYASAEEWDAGAEPDSSPVGRLPGHEFVSEKEIAIRVKGTVRSASPLSYGELIVNGRPEVLLRPQNQKMVSGGFESFIDQVVTVSRSGWIALKFWEPQPDGQSRFVHSAPWYIQVAGKAVQPRPEEKAFLVGRMTQEMERSRGVLSADALIEYQRALEFYEGLQTWEPELKEANRRSWDVLNQDEWLRSMVVDHGFSAHEVRQATGLSLTAARRQVEKYRDTVPEEGFRLRPYPGGRHPRSGFLDGAIAPQRETKISIFPPWKDGGYAVVDVPEAIFSNLGLTFLAHTHIPTIWGDTELEPLEWERKRERQFGQAGFRMRRDLPNGIQFTSRVWMEADVARMRIDLYNGTADKLTNMRVQICTMLRGLAGFQSQESPRELIREKGWLAVRGQHPTRWLITSWCPAHRTWSNPPVPCVHADPIFPDCEPGKSVYVEGMLSFYEGDDIRPHIARLQARFPFRE